MVLASILHFANRSEGWARLTYDDFELTTSLSRTSISSGLSVLESGGIIGRGTHGRNTFLLRNFNPASGWAKFPALRLYQGGQIAFFRELHLRKRTELEGLKLWYFLAARRDNDVNLA